MVTRLPRNCALLRRFVARRRGLFWLPCPCCGEDFSGYEVGHRHVDREVVGSSDAWVSSCCCRWCDTCAGARRERADLAELVGENVARTVEAVGGRVTVWPEGGNETPAEWRCGP